MIKEAIEKDFEELIKEGLVLVDFYAAWCGPCKMMAPILEKISKEFNVVKVNTDENPNLAKAYQIYSIPTFIAFYNGKKVAKKVGYIEESDLREWLKSI